MKFSDKFEQVQSLAFSEHYLPYREFKSKIKIAPSRAHHVHQSLSSCLSQAHLFLDHIFGCLKGTDEICSTKRLDQQEPHELQEIRAILEELHHDYMGLLLFVTSNQEAALRILARLGRVAPNSDESPCLDATAERNILAFDEKRCLGQLEAIRSLQIELDEVCLAPRLVDILGKLPKDLGQIGESNPQSVPGLKLIDHCLRDDEASKLMEALERASWLALKPQQSPANLLHLAIGRRAWKCAKLLVELTPQDDCFWNTFLLSELIASTGRVLGGGRCSLSRFHAAAYSESMAIQKATSLVVQILNHLGPGAGPALYQSDACGRTPIHYAVMYRLIGICRAILQFELEPSEEGFNVRKLLRTDNLNLSALDYSIVYGHIEIAEILLAALDRVCGPRDRNEETDMDKTRSRLLMISFRAEDNDMVRLLMSGALDTKYKSLSGETLLYTTCYLGRLDWVRKVLEHETYDAACLDIAEESCGRTPLIIASIGGHLQIVLLLLQAGANQSWSDHRHWTARDHAAFRGHLPIADMLRPNIQAEEDTYLPREISPSDKAPKYRLQPGRSSVVVNMGSVQKKPHVQPFHISRSNPKIAFEEAHGMFSLEISMSTRENAAYLLRLPLLSSPIHDTMVFPVDDMTEQYLVFRLFRSDSARGQRGMLLGSGIALLQDEICFGRNRESLVRERSVPITSRETGELFGTVVFTAVILKPFLGLETRSKSFDTLQESKKVILVGHRGMGQNKSGSEYLQLGENTIESFLTASELGASYVEFDVQVTRDLVPVLYHDFSLSESGTDVAVHDLTLDQFLHASNVQSARGEAISTIRDPSAEMTPSSNGRMRRSQSVMRNQGRGSKEMRDRMKHTVDFAKNGFKANSRGDFIHGPFATLEEALRKTSESISFDIEIKYPRLHESAAVSIAPITHSLNTFVDSILKLLSQYAKTRNIILSSFTPEVCILLQAKQQAFPVLFITNAGKQPIVDQEERAASVQVAVRFARDWGLAGIMFSSEVFALCPWLIGWVKGKRLVCGSYGVLNSEVGNVELQVQAGIDLIVTDRVKLIAQTLERLQRDSAP